MNERTDEELVLCLKQGNRAAFEVLVYRYKNSIFQYIYGMVKDVGVADDIFQEVFITFFKQIDRFEVRGKFKSWLFLTARNRVFNYIRDQKPALSLDAPDEDGNAFLQEMVADKSRLPLEQLSSEELSSSIRCKMERLPPRQREILYLRSYFSFKEISEMLGRPLGTVLADCHRAIQKMQVLLKEQLSPEEIV